MPYGTPLSKKQVHCKLYIFRLVNDLEEREILFTTEGKLEITQNELEIVRSEKGWLPDRLQDISPTEI